MRDTALFVTRQTGKELGIAAGIKTRRREERDGRLSMEEQTRLGESAGGEAVRVSTTETAKEEAAVEAVEKANTGDSIGDAAVQVESVEDTATTARLDENGAVVEGTQVHTPTREDVAEARAVSVSTTETAKTETDVGVVDTAKLAESAAVHVEPIEDTATAEKLVENSKVNSSSGESATEARTGEIISEAVAPVAEATTAHISTADEEKKPKALASSPEVTGQETSLSDLVTVACGVEKNSPRCRSPMMRQPPRRHLLRYGHGSTTWSAQSTRLPIPMSGIRPPLNTSVLSRGTPRMVSIMAK